MHKRVRKSSARLEQPPERLNRHPPKHTWPTAEEAIPPCRIICAAICAYLPEESVAFLVKILVVAVTTGKMDNPQLLLCS